MERGRTEEPPSVFQASRKVRRRARLLFLAFPVASALIPAYLLTAALSRPAEEVQGPEQGDVRPGIEKVAEMEEAARKEKKSVTSSPSPAESCDDLRVLVDKKHALPGTYVPRDLVSLNALGVPTVGDAPAMLRREAAGQLKRLVNAAYRDGEELFIASAYRSYADQRRTFAHFTGIYGKDARIVSAPPGRSQHQLGTAVDFTSAAADYRLLPSFKHTSASAWLEKNAPDYGFALSFPSGGESETGHQFEPWHYRYVGLENTRRLKDEGLSLQAFLIREGVMPRC